MAKTFQFLAKSVNGEIKEFPQTYTFECGSVVPVGKSLVKAYDDNFCIVVHELYLVRHRGDVFGTQQFDSLQGYEAYIRSACDCCGAICSLIIDGCLLSVDGCSIQVKN